MDESLEYTLLQKSMFEFYVKKGVELPKVELFRNFTLLLNKKIQESYFGDNFMDDEDRKNHFKWCWIKTCEIFKPIDFNKNIKLYEYLEILFDSLFYSIDDKESAYNKESFNNIGIVIESIFNLAEIKTQDSLAIFLEIYNVFNDNEK